MIGRWPGRVVFSAGYGSGIFWKVSIPVLCIYLMRQQSPGDKLSVMI